MMRTTGCAVMMAVGIAVAPIHVNAQRISRSMQARGDSTVGPGVESILRQRERLELSQSQVDQLDEIRKEAVQRRIAQQTEMAEVRSKLLAGEVKPEEVRTMMRSKHEGAGEVRKQEREHIVSILSDTQRQKIQTWMGEARAFRRGRMSARRGRGDALNDRMGGHMARPERHQGRPMRGRARGMMRGRGFGRGFGPGMAPPPSDDAGPIGSGS